MLPLTFKIATEPEEFDQIFQLNYRTFVEEIPQHRPNTALRLVDKFHDQNIYVICLSGGRQLVGMMAGRTERPFSLDAKLENLDAYLPQGRSVCEIRLLAVDPNYRKTRIFLGLLKKAVEYYIAYGCDLAIISGTVRQQKLYQHMGFVPFGPLVGTPDALYQPMYLTLETLRKEIPWIETSAHASPQLSTHVSPQPASIEPASTQIALPQSALPQSASIEPASTQPEPAQSELIQPAYQSQRLDQSGQGQDQSQDRGRGQGQDRSQDWSRGQGQDQRQDQGQGQGQDQRQDQGQGQRQDRSRGQGQNQGQGQGQDQSRDQGQDRSRGQGQDRRQDRSRGQRQDQSRDQSQHQGQCLFPPDPKDSGNRDQVPHAKLRVPVSHASQDNSSCAKASYVPVNLLPGPVHIHPSVRQAFCAPPISHRSRQFVEDVQEIKTRLCELVGSARVELFLGSGTLANDVVGAQLSRQSSSGIILSNGEFGERLVDHASRFGLQFTVLAADWGSPFDYGLIEQFLREHVETGWVWCVHCETSTGVLNDLNRVAAICKERKVLVCSDCISSIGTIPVDLKDIYLASGVSGKGLAAFPGLSIVFSNRKTPPPPDKLPRYLDLGYYAQKSGLPFTTSSNLLYALLAALKRIQPEERFRRIERLSRWLRNELRNRGLHIVAPDEYASAAVISLALPAHLNSRWVGLQLEEQGYLLSYQSEYLLERNWIQICLMGEYSEDTLAPMLKILTELAQKTSR